MDSHVGSVLPANNYSWVWTPPERGPTICLSRAAVSWGCRAGTGLKPTPNPRRALGSRILSLSLRPKPPNAEQIDSHPEGERHPARRPRALEALGGTAASLQPRSPAEMRRVKMLSRARFPAKGKPFISGRLRAGASSFQPRSHRNIGAGLAPGRSVAARASQGRSPATTAAGGKSPQGKQGKRRLGYV